MKKSLLAVVFILNSVFLFSQKDSLVFFNNNIIVGEIKSMDKGVLVLETDYSDADFKIEIEKIKELYTESSVVITLEDGTRLDGPLNSIGDGKLVIKTADGDVIINNINDIVGIRAVDKTFGDRLSASIDIGFDITRANNFRQFNSRSSIGYLAKKWSLDAYYNTILSNQDDADSIKRIESGLQYKQLLPKDWYLPASLDFLSNTEQKLRLRTSFRLGAGNYIIHSNSVYWAFTAGLNLNDEKYSHEGDNRTSMEGFLGTEFNMFDVGDLNLLTKIYVYPSFTEGGRWRSDLNLDLKYDLPLDFYVSLGVTVNVDNRPVEDSHKLDYILHSGFGWEW